MKVGLIALARPTFDVAAAAPLATEAFNLATSLPVSVVGTPELAMDPETVRAHGARLGPVDALVIVQATFTDSTLHAAAVAQHPDAPLILWAFPEPRTGERLRLNSLCGINLAAFRLASRDLRWLYADPHHAIAGPQLGQALTQPRVAKRRELPSPGVADHRKAADLAARLGGYRIGVIGDHPEGFEPCGYTETELQAAGGPTIDRIELEDLFSAARKPEPAAVADLEQAVARKLSGLAELDQEGVEGGLRLHLGLRSLGSTRNWDAVATRCWPECFTEFGGAACAAQGMLDELAIPATCERDVFGAITALLLQETAGSSPFVADLVDIDPTDNTATVWHCGIAPLSLAHPEDRPQAEIHPNRRLPLIHQFRLRPGRITIARLSRSPQGLRLTIGGAEILDRPRPYSGTSAVIRPDSGAEGLLDTVMAERLEHHYGLVHGDVRGVLVALADRLGLGIISL